MIKDIHLKRSINNLERNLKSQIHDLSVSSIMTRADNTHLKEEVKEINTYLQQTNIERNIHCINSSDRKIN